MATPSNRKADKNGFRNQILVGVSILIIAGVLGFVTVKAISAEKELAEHELASEKEYAKKSEVASLHAKMDKILEVTSAVQSEVSGQTIEIQNIKDNAKAADERTQNRLDKIERKL